MQPSLNQHPLLYFNPLPSHEGRHNPPRSIRHFDLFQSTSFSRRKTGSTSGSTAITVISIHFLLTKEDFFRYGYRNRLLYFNPLPSHEGRHPSPDDGSITTQFQSTSFSRRKTNFFADSALFKIFQSTSFSRRKTAWRSLISPSTPISIHFLLTKEDPVVIRVKTARH